jgi:DNA-binding NarL/FixJ family response regulator
LAELNDYENRIAEATKQKEEERRQKEEERRQKEEAIRKQEEAVRLLLSLGMPAAEIAQKLGLSLKYVTALEKS